MATHRIETFVDDDLSVPGHTALVGHNHATRAQSLTCDDCGTPLGSFEPGRWRGRRIAEVWHKHLADAR